MFPVRHPRSKHRREVLAAMLKAAQGRKTRQFAHAVVATHLPLNEFELAAAIAELLNENAVRVQPHGKYVFTEDGWVAAKRATTQLEERRKSTQGTRYDSPGEGRRD